MKRYLPFSIIILILALTFFYPSVEVTSLTDPKFNTGDIAWMLMSTALGVDHDTRTRIFLRWHGH
jgi:Amt family ammonium transporter